LPAPGVEQGGLVTGRGRRFSQDLLGQCHLPVFQLGPKALDRGLKRVEPALGVAEGGLGGGVLYAHQNVALFDDVALADQDFGQDAAFQVLDDLGLAGGHDLSLASGNFVQDGQFGPERERDEKEERHDRQDIGEALAAPVHGRVDIGHEV
jgi:hypothetical protein